MVTTRLVLAAGSGSAVGGSAGFFPIGCGYLPPGSANTEAAFQTMFRNAGTLSNLYVRATAASASGNTTFVTRKTTTSMNLTVSVTTSTPGVYEDITHSDSVASGDLWGISYTPPGTGTTVRVVAVTFNASSTTYTKMVCVSTGNGLSYITASATRFNTLGGILSVSNITEANAKVRIRVAGTFANGGIYARTNARTATTFRGRKNGGNGNIVATVTASTPGFYEDTVNTDVVAAGDDYCSTFVSGTGSSSTVFTNIQFDFTDVTNRYGLQQNGVTTAVGVFSNTTTYYPLGGNVTTTTTEADTECLAKDIYICKELTILLATNTITAALTIRLRKAGADGTQITSITASTAGIFSDSVHTDTLAATDDINYKLIVPNNGTSMTIWNFTMAMQGAADPVITTRTLTRAFGNRYTTSMDRGNQLIIRGYNTPGGPTFAIPLRAPLAPS